MIALSAAAHAGVNDAAVAQVSASWVAPTSGVWHDPANWSTNPLYPNNGTPADATYDVTIAATGSNPYTVTMNDALGVSVNTLNLSSPHLRFEHGSGTLTLGSSAATAFTQPPLRIANGAIYHAHEGVVHLAAADQLSQIGVGGSGQFLGGNGTVVQRGHVAVGMGGGSLGAGAGSLSIGRWLRHPSSHWEETLLAGLGPLGSGTLNVTGYAAGTFGTVSVGVNGGHGTLLVGSSAHLTANRMMIGQGDWLVEGAGTSGFGVATLNSASARITIASLDGSLPGLLSIGGGNDGLGSGRMFVTAGTLSTTFLRMSSTGLLDVRGGHVTFGVGQNLSGTILLSGNARIDNVVSNLTGNAELHISSGTFSTGSLTATANGAQTIHVSGGAVSIGTLALLGGTSTFAGGTIVNPGGITIGGNANVTLAAGNFSTATVSIGGGGNVSYGGGTLNLTALHMSGGRFALAPGANLRLDVKSLDIDGPATLDLADNPLTIDYSGVSPIDEVRADIAGAFAAGAWTGSGITSALADADMRGLGYADIAGATVIVRLTRYGDANLDRVVNIADFTALAASFGNTGAVWSDGDFNYDGIVNIRDFNRLAANFGLTASGPEVTSGDWAALASAVPEPGAVGLLVLAAGSLFARRRRRCQG